LTGLINIYNEWIAFAIKLIEEKGSGIPMKALILAAGLGTRLKALTTNRPKALMPIVNRPIIARTIDYLKAHGVDHIAVNAHHHSLQVMNYLNGGEPFGVDIEVRVEAEILGTGGGIKNFSDFWEKEPFIVINSDILTDISLSSAFEYHLSSGLPATLILHDYEQFNQISINESCQVIDISRQKNSGRLAFTGIHILNPEILSCIPGPGYSDIIDCYRTLIQSGGLGAYVSENHYWRDIGSPDSYIAAHGEILAGEDNPFIIGPGSIIKQAVKFKGWAAVGADAVLEKGVELERSILWDHVTIKEGVRVENSIVTSSNVIDGDLINKII
jgi:mannose-1-phosphate guanylyltransferase